MPETAAYSTRGAESLAGGTGRGDGGCFGEYVDPVRLKEVLGVPEGVIVVAYSYVGYVEGFWAGPELERVKWESGVGLDAVVFEGR